MGPKPYHPNPKEDGNMDGVEEASPVLQTQEFNNAVDAVAAGIEPEFIVVSRTKATYRLKFPVSCFDQGASLTTMSKWTADTLKTVASIKPKSFSLETIPNANNPEEKFIVFQVFTAYEAEAACKHGGEDKEGNVIHFEAFTPEAQALQQGRILKISNLSYDTTEDHIRAALSKYGEIEVARPSFNVKATMITATVIYKTAKSIQALKDLNTTYVQVRDDIATVTWLGNEPVHFDALLTKKLARLPIGITPVEIANCFCHPEQENLNSKRIPFHSIVMPRNIYTNKRQPEALIQFSSLEQQQIATSAAVVIGSHETCWTTFSQPTCRHCGDPTHFISNCIIKSSSASASAGRRSNIQTIKARTRSQSTASRPFTQVPRDVTTSAKKQTTSTRTTGVSYASAVSTFRNQGSAVSNPIVIGTLTPSAATTPSAGVASAASSSVAHSGNPTNGNTPIQAQMAKLEQQQLASIASIRADMQANNVSLRVDMQAMFAQFIAALNGTGTQSTHSSAASASIAEGQEEADKQMEEEEEEEEEDSSLEEEDTPMEEEVNHGSEPSQDYVPDSLPPSPAASTSITTEIAPNVAKTQRRPITPPAKPSAYSVNLSRVNAHGGRTLAKSDRQRGPSLYTEEPKRTAVVRKTPHNSTSITQLPHPVPQQTPADHMNTTLTTLNATIQELRADLARQREQYEQEMAALRDENRQLMAQINQFFTNNRIQQSGSQDANPPAMTTQEVEEYGSAEHVGSATPNLHYHGSETNVDNSQAPPSDSDL
jgi:hypothetical protein